MSEVQKKSSVLSLVSKPKNRAVLCTITGDSGMGKTSLAALFPKPIFIRAEDGLQSIDEKNRPDAFPPIKKADDLWEQFTALINEQHSYKTVVIDSVTALERLFIDHIVASDPKQPKSINQALGGYGAGLMAVAGMHQRVRKAAGLLIEKGINVVFIAHADTNTLELPDEDPYSRYDLRLSKKSVPFYVDDVDLVGFIKLETFTTGDGERKKAISDGTRILITYATAANVSKNRFNITEPLVLPKGINPLKQYIKVLGE